MRAKISALVVVVMLVAACGGARQKAISTSFVALNSMRDGLADWSRERQEQLADQAPTADDAKQQVTAFRQKRQVMLAALIAAYSALSVATLDLNDTTFREAMTAMKKLIAALDALRGDGK